MKTKIAFTVILFSLTSILVFSQEKSKKELREEKKIEKQNQIEALINEREFVFIGSIAYPRGLSPVNLASRQNFVKFQPDMIESEMPFFGRAYSGVGFGGDAGLQFKGIPEDFTVVKGKMTPTVFLFQLVLRAAQHLVLTVLTEAVSPIMERYQNQNNADRITEI
jgi:hypothetical protein